MTCDPRQSAMLLAAQNGNVDVVLALLDSHGVDLEATSCGVTAAQAARRAGHAALADIIAGAARDQQISAILAAVTAAGTFDCLADRIGALAVGAGAPAPDQCRAMCIVCIDAPVEVALLPCCHAALCADCAVKMITAEDMRCPICRAAVDEFQRIYLA
jgi:hypothetical protein